MVELADTRDLKSLGSDIVPVQVRLAAPKNKALLRKCFIFIQSEGLVCNRRQAYVIRLQRKRYVIKSQDLYVFSSD